MKFRRVLICMFCLAATICAMQVREKSDGKTVDKASGTAKSLSKLTGTIGQDGKTFTSDADRSAWTISNSDKVKSHEGHHVVVRGKADDTTKTIEVTSVTIAGAKAGKGAKKGGPGTGTNGPP